MAGFLCAIAPIIGGKYYSTLDDFLSIFGTEYELSAEDIKWLKDELEAMGYEQ